MESLKCIFVDWQYAYELCKDVFLKIRASGFRPDVVIAVARGGWFLGRALCDFFLIKELFSVKVEHWGVAATEGRAELRCWLDENAARRVEGKNVLITDDITDTGDSLRILLEHCRRSLNAKEVRTATMQHKTSSSITPDYYGEVLKEWKWVIYPWSIHEDLFTLIPKVLGEGKTIEQIKERLRDAFDIYISQNTLEEVLENMLHHGKVEKKGKLWTPAAQ
ncbi:phosphoribosyltransferase [Candidatus Alkanophaga liquidiphilum]|nr:Hypoxanthine phosphoribosyltransferase [Candidatus Alkanophaga liquidiphilum]RLG37902.1 MAG: phosphoribosyltransferase [Candidatus Alkanophagales archaeon]